MRTTERFVLNNVVNVSKVDDGEIYTCIKNDGLTTFEIHSSSLESIVIQQKRYLSKSEKLEPSKGILDTVDIKPAIKSRCINYSPKFKTLFICLDFNEIVYKNGREVRKNKYKQLDTISDDLGLTTSEKIVRRFAIFPMKMNSGKFIWLKPYYSYFGSAWGTSLHSGWSWRHLIRESNLSQFLKIVAKNKSQNETC